MPIFLACDKCYRGKVMLDLFRFCFLFQRHRQIQSHHSHFNDLCYVFWGIILFVYGPNADDSVVGYAFICGCAYFKVFNHISKLIFVCDKHETNCQVVIGGIFFDLSSLLYCCLFISRFFPYTGIYLAILRQYPWHFEICPCILGMSCLIHYNCLSCLEQCQC